MFIGTSTFRKDILTAHWKSQSHVKSTERQALLIKAKSNAASTSQETDIENVGAIVECVRKIDSSNEERIKKLINTVYYVCHEEIAFKSYNGLIGLQEKNGLDLGNFYRSDNACRRFLKYIYEDLFQNSLNELSKKRFFSILIDGATDTSVTECELIYLRYLSGGKPVNHYLSIEDIKNANAPGIISAIEKAFENSNISNWKDRLIGMGSDGASVNLGVRGGVAALLRNDVGHLVSIHCVAHRLELAANNAIKKHRVMRDIQDMLNNVYKHYHYSPKVLRELREIADALEEKVLKPTNLHGTRWLPHIHKALRILVKNFVIILTHFDHIMGARTGNAEVQGRATNISRKLKDYKFLYMVFFMLDILEVLSTLSLKSQLDNITLSEFFEAILTTHLSLVEMQTTHGVELSKFINSVHNGKFFTVELKKILTVGNQDELENQKKEILNLIIDALDQRFSSMEKDPVMKATVVILELSNYPDVRDDLAGYGSEEMDILVDHFHQILDRNDCDFESILNEWREFKAHVSQHKKMPIEHYFIFDKLSQRFKNLLMLIEILLDFPLSSSACERGFSAMKRVKSDWRSSLAPNMMRKLMHISIEGPSLEDFDATSVINRWWNTGRSKRPGFNPFEHQGKSIDQTELQSYESDESE